MDFKVLEMSSASLKFLFAGEARPVLNAKGNMLREFPTIHAGFRGRNYHSFHAGPDDHLRQQPKD
jgi:hypothetical protein